MIDDVPQQVDDVQRALVQIVLDGGGLADVAAALVTRLGGAVVITTPNGRVLTEAGDPGALAALYGATCFEPGGRLRVEAERAGLTRHRGLNGSHVLMAVVSGRVDHGRILAYSPTAELHEDDVTALQSAATVAALAITKQLAVRAVESKYSGDFLRDVLAGRVDAGQARTQASHLGWNLDRPMVVVVAELDEAPPEPEPGLGSGPAPILERFSATWQSLLRPRDAGAAIAGFHREVVAVLGVPEVGDVDRFVRELVQDVSASGPRLPFSTGVSQVVEDAAGLATGYEQARIAMQVSRRTQGAGTFAHFGGLGVFRLLSLVDDPGKLQAFAAETLGELAHDDDPELVDLRRTLEVLLDTNLNVAQTARQLHFHYNTLRYRIAKLERMLGSFSTDPQLRLSLHVALQVVQMRGY